MVSTPDKHNSRNATITHPPRTITVGKCVIFPREDHTFLQPLWFGGGGYGCVSAVMVIGSGNHITLLWRSGSRERTITRQNEVKLGAVACRFGNCEWLKIITRWHTGPLGEALSDSGASEM